MIGQIISNYKVVREIDTGGMGTVYLGKHLTLDKEVAIKKLHPHLTKDKNIRKRFSQEAETQSRLKHEGITNIIDYLDDEKGLFIILDYVEGLPLNKYIFEEKGLIPEGEANDLMVKILDAVGYAHSKNVIHRDLKPSNIMVLPTKDIKILDFGIAKIIGNDKSLTQTGTKLGSPLYMSPEQVLGKDVDQRSDIYSLGVLYYEMLTGNPVYNQQTTTQFQIYNKIVKEPLPRVKEIYAHTSDVAQEIIDKATCKDIGQRFKSCTAFIEALSHGEVYEKVVEDSTRKKSKNIKKLAIGLFVLSLIMISGFIFYKQYNINKYNDYCTLGFSNIDAGLYKNAMGYYETAISYVKSDSIEEKISGLDFLISGLDNFYGAKYSKAFELFKSGADFGNKEAYYYLGELTYNGLGTIKNYDEGWKFTERSYELGFGMAAWRVGNAYENGIGVEKDIKKANEFYEEAYNNMLVLSKNGDPEALGNLGSMFSNGNFVDENPEKAFSYYQESAETGYAFIQSNLANCYLKGYGVEKNIDEGIKWLKKSSELGHPTAMLSLGNMYLNGEGITMNKSKGIELIKAAADKNYPYAFSKLGYLYYTGEGVTKDYQKSFSFTKKAVEFDEDNIVALENLAFAYKNGIGAKMDYFNAVKYYEKAYFKDTLRTLNLVNIAKLYKEGGYGIEQDEEMFLDYCVRAVNNGDEDAKFLILKHYNEKGITHFKQKDYNNAVKYFEIAMDNGGGETVKKNLSTAQLYHKVFNKKK